MHRTFLLALALLACEPTQSAQAPTEAVDVTASAVKVARTITLTPATATVPYGTAQTYSARVVYSDGSTATNPASLVWGTSAVGPNSLTLTAALNGITGTATVALADALPPPPPPPPPDTTIPPPPMPPLAGQYTTTFGATENPISEAGLWRHTADARTTPVRTASGYAYGTQTGTNGTDDASAYLLGFGANYEVDATLRMSGHLGDGSTEAEILLRWTDDNPVRQTQFGQSRVIGYEINMNVEGGYLSLARYKDPSSLREVDHVGPLATGDKFRARVEGQRIRVWVKDVLRIDYTDPLTAGGIPGGNPGIGFFISAPGVLPSDFGFDAVTVTPLDARP